MAPLLLAITVSIVRVAAGIQDAFLDGVVRADELTVKPVVRVKQVPYVERSKLKAASDTLRLEFVIERDGTVKAVRVADVTGDARVFEAPAIEAMKGWRFDPGSRAGAAVRTLAAATVRFKLTTGQNQTPLRPGFNRGPARELGSIALEGVDDPFLSGVLRADDPGVTPPSLVERRSPKYPTGKVMQDGIQGNVHMEAVITRKGAIGNLRVVQSVDDRLNAAALEAARHWTFKPAMKDGEPVATAVVIEMEFLLYTGLPHEATRH